MYANEVMKIYLFLYFLYNPSVNHRDRLNYKCAHLMTVASVNETTYGPMCSDYIHHMREKHYVTLAKYNF